MVAFETSYADFTRIEVSHMPPKQKGEVQDIIMINGRAATTVRGAAHILSERAEKMGYTRTYSRDTVYRLLIDHQIDAIRTPSANYYYVDQLENVPLQPGKGKPEHRTNYPSEIKEQARQLRTQGLTQRAIAERLGVRFQTVGYWLRKSVLLV